MHWNLLRTVCISVAILIAPHQAWPVDRPIIVIPGILGSVLKDKQGNVVWGDVQSLLHLDILTVPNGPHDPDDGIKPDGIIGNIVLFGPIKVREYSALRDFLLQLGYQPGTTYFEFAYDWRNSNFTSARALADFVKSTPALQGKDFDIIAHSMGGLVARVYAQQFNQDRRIVRMINLAVPFLGSVSAFSTLTDGWGRGANLIAGGMKTIRKFALSLPAFYELLPKYDNCCVLGRPNETDRVLYNPLTVSGWRNVDWQSDQGGDKYLDAALSNARRIRELAATAYPPEITIYNIVGGSIDTRWQYYVDPAQKTIARYNLGPGDGTVAEGSASNNKSDRAFVSMAQHQSIFADDSAQTTLRRILQNQGLPANFKEATKSVLTKDGAVVEITSAAIQLASVLIATSDEVEITLAVTGQSGADLDKLNVIVSADGAVESTQVAPLSARLMTTPINATGIYQGKVTAGQQSGVITIRATVQGLPPLEDYVGVLPRN